jgi:nuclear migration protein JNM1
MRHQSLQTIIQQYRSTSLVIDVAKGHANRPKQATTIRSPSEDESEGDDNDGPGVSHSHLRIDQARSRFMPSNVDARDVDFSERVNGKRKSYKTSSRRQKVLDDGTTELGDLSDEEVEDLERKLARLRRELEEAKEDLRKEKAEANGNSAAALDEDDITSLSQALAELSQRASRPLVPIPRVAGATQALESASTPANADRGSTDATYTVTYEPIYEETHALAKAADFDRRLTQLEKALGLGSSALEDELSSNAPSRAVLPTLDTLQKQMNTLSQASTASLDSISRRVRTLAQEAEQLEKSRRSAQAAQEALASSGATGSDASGAAEDMEQTTKITALYGTLPTIESLAPLLPPLLDRLRSLRLMHADAANASETIRQLEEGQRELAGEIKQWTEGLDKLERAMQSGEAAATKNSTVIEGWVTDLQQRVSKLS